MARRAVFATDMLAKRAMLTPDRTALIDTADGSEITFAAWDGRVNRTARYLHRLGIERGDRVAVYSSNRAEYLDLFWAAGRIGAVLQNLNWRLTVHELSEIVADGEPSVLVYSPDWAESVERLRPGLTTVSDVVALEGPAAGDRHFVERFDEAPDPVDRPGLDLDDAWGIYYTGGTTGLPKGAVLTHGNVTWNSVNTITSWGLHAGHVAALQLPFFHVGGPNIFMVPLVHVGGRTILCAGFDVDETFDLIAGAGLTHYVAVPTMYQMMQEHSRWAEADFSHLELVISGGAPCPLPIMERFWEKGVDFKMGYGLTEATANNFWLPPEDVRRKPQSVGYPIMHIDMRVVRPDGSECDPDEEGELLIKGPHVMREYWRRPEATAETIVDGWLHTGDVARCDAEGYFTIMGRSKDMFISGGENVYPAEVESVLHAHPDVVEAALVGVPDLKWGEVGRAFVVKRSGSSLSEEDLVAFLSERLAGYKLPRSVVFLEALPKTVIGKIDKKVLAAEGGGS
jgi:fatty-acyl-CoA synthase